MPLVPYAVVIWCFIPEYSSPRNSVACGGYPRWQSRVSRIPGITLSKNPLASLSKIIPGVFFCVNMSMVRTLLSMGVMLVWCDLKYWCFSMTYPVFRLSLLSFLVKIILFLWLRSDYERVMMRSLLVFFTPGIFSSIRSSTRFHLSGQNLCCRGDVHHFVNTDSVPKDGNA